MEWSEKDGDDCWEGRTLVGKNEYDIHVLPIYSEVEEGNLKMEVALKMKIIQIYQKKRRTE